MTPIPFLQNFFKKFIKNLRKKVAISFWKEDKLQDIYFIQCLVIIGMNGTSLSLFPNIHNFHFIKAFINDHFFVCGGLSVLGIAHPMGLFNLYQRY